MNKLIFTLFIVILVTIYFSIFPDEINLISSYRIMVASVTKNKSQVVSDTENKLREELISYLTYTEKVEVIDRDKLNTLLKEQALGQMGVIDEKNAVKAGKLLGAQKMASVSVNGNRFKVSLTNIETGKEEFSLPGAISDKEQVFKSFVKFIEHRVLLHNMSLLKSDSYDINISFKASKKKYKNNEKIQFSLKVNTDSYLYLILIQSNGDIISLFPNEDHPENFVKANEEISIPDKNSGFIFAAGEPFGTDVVKAIASKKKLDLFQPKKMEGTPFGQLDSGDDALRGIKRISTGKASEWNSAELSLEIVE